MRVWKKIPNCWRCDFFNSAQSRVVSRESAFVYDGSASGALYLDTPRQITDTSGNVVWQWDNSDPFGNNVPNQNPNGAGQFSFPLRFAGQYYDSETNTHYNVNRDYDPTIGRYIESDPIGLQGGINTFAYVGGNPISRKDRKGLDWDDLIPSHPEDLLPPGFDPYDPSTYSPVPTQPNGSIGVSATVGSTTVGISTASSGAQWGQTTAIGVGASVDVCANIPKDNSCPNPSSPRGPDSYTVGYKNLGATYNSNGSVCVSVGVTTPSSVPIGVGWNTNPH